MSFVAQCTYCGQKGRVHNRALGESVECPRCHNWYTAAPADDLPMPSRPMAVAPAPAAPPPPADVAPIASSLQERASSPADEPAPASMGAEAPVRRPGATIPMPPVRRRRAHRWIHVGGLAGCLLGSLGLVAASQAWLAFVTIPMSAAGLAIGIGAVIHAGSSKPLRRVLPIAGTVVSALVLLAATLAPRLLGPVFEASRQPSGYSPSAVLVVPLQIGTKDTQALEIDGWADAGRAVLHHERVRVQIVGVALGPAILTVPKGPSKESYLAITLVVQHLGNGPAVEFTHWGAAGVQPTPHPTLTQAGRKLEYHQVEAEVVAGQVRQAQKLYPGKAFTDLLLFEAGAAGLEPLRLELPAEAWGGRGVLRFHIPAAMIQQKQPKGK